MLIQKKVNKIIYGFCVVFMIVAGIFVGKSLSQSQSSSNTMQTAITPIEDVGTLIESSDTIAAANFVSISEPYGVGPGSLTVDSGKEIDLNEYYVDIEVRVTNVLKGDVQEGNTIVIQKHIGPTPDNPVPSMNDSQEYLFFLNSGNKGEPLHMLDSNVCQYTVSENGEILPFESSRMNRSAHMLLEGMTLQEVYDIIAEQ